MRVVAVKALVILGDKPARDRVRSSARLTREGASVHGRRGYEKRLNAARR
jgi:hypothetical protein